MNSNRPRGRQRSLTRRDFAKVLGAAGLGMVTVPLMPRPLRAAGETTYFTWSGYDVPELHQTYTEQHGRPPEFSFFASESEALQKVVSGFTPDLAHPCIYDLGRWRDSGVIEPIDSNRLKHWPDLFDELKAVSGSTDGGQQWFVPFDWGNGSVLYRTDLVDVQEDSWSILFDERYEGRLSMWDSIDGAMNVAGLMAGVENVFAMTDEELDRVQALLEKQKKLLRFYWNDQSEAEQALASGEVVAAYVWNASVQNLKNQGLPVRYMRPKEGILTWVCGLVKIKDAPGDEQAAYDLIDSMLDPSTTGHFLIDGYGYGHANRKSFETVSAERLDELGLPANPAEMFAESVVLRIMDPKVRERYVRLFEQVKAAS